MLFCGKDFVSLGRHEWRCRSRLNRTSESGFENATTNSQADVNIDHISTTKIIRCACGKSWASRVLQCISVAVVLFAICS